MADLRQPVELEVLLPVHNEAETIEATIREIYAEFSPRVPMRFIVCEDGSSDGTKEILTRLSTEIPMNLSLSDARKGYSCEVRDGMQALDRPPICCASIPTGSAIPRTFGSSGWPATMPTC